MSGHSKWSTIKRQKGVTDQKRGQLFGKLSRAITMAVREGGGTTDPAFNFRLRLAIDKAKASNMPKDNIDRAVAKGAGADADSHFEEVVYEGFGPSGVAIIVEGMTDKKQRTVAEVKNIFEKNGGTFGNSGSVSYLFNKVAELLVNKDGKNMDDILSIALEAGVEDIEEEEGKAVLDTAIPNLQNVQKVLEEQGITIEDAGIIYKPLSPMQLSEADKEKVMLLLEKLEDNEDVQNVFTNADL
jgi:YebC/PmpR family DNA-binding regulatory protein